MDDSLDKKLDFKDRLISFLNKNKLKLIIFFIILLVSVIVTLLFNENQNRKKILLSDKFVKAGLLFSTGNTEKAKQHYDEIILSKNKFYSLLALNKILEKNLEKDQEKILNYFSILEKINFSANTYDLVQLKKALFLINNSKKQSGIKILENLIEKNSDLKSIAEEIILK